MVDSNLDNTLRSAISIVQKEKTLESLKFFCAQLEFFDMFYESKGSLEKKALKTWCIKAGQVFNGISTLKKDPNMLRIYQIVAKLSENMKETGIYDQLETTGYFKDCLKFHVLWAEGWAKMRNVQKFREVVELARHRIKGIPTREVEDSFRDFAATYFPGENHIFISDHGEEETAMIFANSNKAKAKNRRRSSVAFIQQKAIGTLEKKTSEPYTTFPTGGKTKLRVCFIDRDDYIGVSIEEFREALLKDRVDMDDDMDITAYPPQSNDIPVHTISSDTLVTSSQSRSNERKKVFGMSCVSEETERESSTCDDKRRRLYSPAQKTSESVFTRRSNMTEELTPCAPTQVSQSSNPVTSFGDGSYIENFNKAAALFSETVNLDRVPMEDQTMPLVNDQVEKIEVYMDETSMHSSQMPEISPAVQPIQRAPLRSVSNPSSSLENCGDNITSEKKIAPFTISDQDMEELENFHLPRQIIPSFDDEVTVAGFRSQGLESGHGIVTSTPAHFMNRQPTHEDFFAVKTEEEMEEDEDEDDDDGDNQGALGFMKRRNSLAPKANLNPEKPKLTSSVPSNSMQMALENMNLGNDDDLDRTGICRPMEEISSEVNPWDSGLRHSIMKNGHYIPPIEQHDYHTDCTKVSKNKVMVIGGERIQVLDMVGEGGFAKVFRCINEEKQTLALKYEIPSCSWEVYICDQVSRRLKSSDGPFSKAVFDNSIMKISDAYIFSNASILLNEFHPFGTVLDLANKMKDPHWMIIVFLAINIARVLREVHNVNIIHGDAKPDNFMILGPIPDLDSCDKILDHSVVKLIDWGRAIDMKYLSGKTFTGRGGTEKFDCPEMIDGRPWTYQTDYFNFVSTMNVIALGKYSDVIKNNKTGRYEMSDNMKRRLICRDMMTSIFDRFLNAPSCDNLPNWDSEIELMSNFFREKFNAVDWRAAVTKFNQSLPNP